MKKYVYLFVTVIAIFVFHHQTLAQQAVDTIYISEKPLPDFEATYFVCNYETLPGDYHTYIVAEYNTGIIQESIVTHLEDSIRKYVDLVLSEVKQIYGADAIIGLKSEARTSENGEMLIILTGIPVKWANFKPLAEYYRETRKARAKKETPKKGAFGIDLGFGAIVKNDIYKYYGDSAKLKYRYPVFAIGARYLYHINPHIDADLIKINFNCPFRAAQDAKMINLQFMTGIRGYTPSFFKTMSGYAAARIGYGIYFVGGPLQGFAFETEVGLNITRFIFAAFSYNLSSVFVVKETDADPWGFNKKYQYYGVANFNTCAVRIGCNF